MPVKRGRALGLLIWTALTLGVTAFVGGGALLGWATVVGRRDLWFIGGPAALGGQMAMLLGLVLQLHRLARDSRRAAGKLDKLDGESASCGRPPPCWAPRTARPPRPSTPISPTRPARKSS